MEVQDCDLSARRARVARGARDRVSRGESADEYISLARVGGCTVYLAASQDVPANAAPTPHANDHDSFLYMIDGALDVTFRPTGESCVVQDGGGLSVPAGVEHVARFERLSFYLSVVDTGGPDSGRAAAPGEQVLESGRWSDGRDYAVVYCPRPAPAVRQSIVSLARKLTPRWFTPNVPGDIERDLLFQDAVVFRLSGECVAFAVLTCLDRAVQITLLGTDPLHQGQGMGARVLVAVRSVAASVGVESIRVMTTPPDVNPAFGPTVEFYKKQGFRVKRVYTELWEHGAIELELRFG